MAHKRKKKWVLEEIEEEGNPKCETYVIRSKTSETPSLATTKWEEVIDSDLPEAKNVYLQHLLPSLNNMVTMVTTAKSKDQERSPLRWCQKWLIRTLQR